MPWIVELTEFESGFFWVLGDVVSQVIVLLYTADEMIERFLLPEVILRANQRIDPKRGLVQPRIKLTLHHLRGRERG